MTRAVVFAYHTVGVRCLEVLLKQGIEVALVVTHNDNPKENIWFERVSDFAQLHGIPFITPENPNHRKVRRLIEILKPDLFFSFYYRQMLKAPLLAIPKKGAYNLHGSLLPKYRGRVPINWAVIHGETETGATLHAMTIKPDQGDIVAQVKVPIGPDDTAGEVFQRVTAAGTKALKQALPALVAGNAPHIKQNLRAGSYFGGRRPKDGRIDWSLSAQSIHNLVRGVAPPYPGATTTLRREPVRLLRTSLTPTNDAVAQALCGDGKTLYILAMEVRGQPLDAIEFQRCYPKGVKPR
jgi:methionyl-tRNA formyltransferase